MVPGPAWGYSRMVGEGSGESSHGRQDTHGCSLHKAAATSSGRAPTHSSQGKHSPTHRQRTDKMARGRRWGRQAQGVSPRLGRGVLVEWFITILSHKAGGSSTHELQAPDRRPPRAHANSATWSSANTGRPRRHRTQNGEQGWGDGSLERGLVSPTLGRTGKIRFVLLVKCPFPGYFLSPYCEK